MVGKGIRIYLRTAGTILVYLAVLLLVVGTVGTRASAREYLSDSDQGRRVMADYIVHFAHHLQWPMEAFSGRNAPFRICVMGSDRLGSQLEERLRHHRIHGRRVQTENLPGDELQRVRSCQIVVLGQMERGLLLQAMSALEFFPVLTVSDSQRFAASGGMVGFIGSGDRLSLQLNKTRLERADINIGTSVFRLGR